jgi:hypothetical protein
MRGIIRRGAGIEIPALLERTMSGIEPTYPEKGPGY